MREIKIGTLVLFVVDASGSMGAQRRMVAVKGAISSLLLDSYQRRDKVALISFRGTDAHLLLLPASSVGFAHALIRRPRQHRRQPRRPHNHGPSTVRRNPPKAHPVNSNRYRNRLLAFGLAAPGLKLEELHAGALAQAIRAQMPTPDHPPLPAHETRMKPQ